MICVGRNEHRWRDDVGSAGASPSQGPSSGREGEAPADPELLVHSALNLVTELGFRIDQ